MGFAAVTAFWLKEESKMAGLPTVSRRAGQVVTRQVKPLLSLDKDEARVRVLALYRAWYRQLPIMFKDWDMNVTEKMLKDRLKEEFMKHAHIKDIKVIDMKVIQGQQELQECANRWQEPCVFMSKWFKEQHIDERPKDFMSKFLHGHE